MTNDIDFGRIARETWAKIRDHEYATEYTGPSPEPGVVAIIAAALEDTVKLALHLEHLGGRS